MTKGSMDATDVKILEKLDENIRAGSKEIGETLGLRRQVVDYRIKRLETSGAIIAYRMLANLTKLGLQYRRVHLKLYSASLNEEEVIFKFLEKHPGVHWLVECDGKYDMMIGITSIDTIEFNNVLSAFLVTFNKYISYYDIVHILNLTVPSRDFSGMRHVRSIKGAIVGNFNAESLSTIDKKIINELAENGRQTALEVAKKIKQRPENVNYHIKQIIKKGLLFSNIQFGYDVFGFELYKTLIYVRNPSRERIESFKKFARGYPRIWDIVETVGKWQLELDIESRGHDDYYKIMDAVQDNFSDIVSYYDTLYIRKERKFLFSPF